MCCILASVSGHVWIFLAKVDAPPIYAHLLTVIVYVLLHLIYDGIDIIYTGELVYDGLNGTRKIVPSYSYDTYWICMGLEPSISSVIAKSVAYSGPLCAISPVLIWSVISRCIIVMSESKTRKLDGISLTA